MAGPWISIDDGRPALQHGWREGFGRSRLRGADLSCPEEDAPAWRRVLDRDGRVRTHDPGDAAALATVPAGARALAGWLGDQPWVALEAQRHVRGFGRFLRQEREAGNRGFVIGVWKTSRAWRLTRAERIRLARRMVREPRDQLLSDLTGAPYPAAAVRQLSRLEPPPRVGDAELLAALCALPGPAAALARAPGLNTEGLRLLLHVPVWLRTERLLGLLIGQVSETEMAALFPPPLRRPSDAVRRRLRQSLATARDWPDLRYLLKRAADRAAAAQPPVGKTAPAPLDDRLRPLPNAEDLKAEGRDMRHCIGSYAAQVLAGTHRVFAWSGRERATVTLRRDPSAGGWRLQEAHGPDNRGLSAATWAEIEQAVDPLIRPLPVWTTDVAGLLHHDASRLRRVLSPGDPLQLEREPSNPHDPLAVAVRLDGFRLGYIPRARNAAIATRLDAGHPVPAEVDAPWTGDKWRLSVRVDLTGCARVPTP